MHMIRMNYRVNSRIKTIAIHAARYIFLIAMSYVLFYPIIFMIASALKSPLDYFDPSVEWIPKNWTLQNFKIAIEIIEFWDALKSTLINQIVAALIQVFSCMVAAYGLAKFNFKGKKILQGAMILTILVPSAMTILPSYVGFKHMDFLGILNLIGNLIGKELRPSVLDSPLVFFLPSIFAVGLKSGFFIYIYNQFFKGIPKEIEEAAWIDGAGAGKTFLSIIVPSSGVVIITVFLFSVIWHYNDYYLAQMYLSDHYPLSVNIQNIYGRVGFSGLNLGVTTLNKGAVIMAACSFLIVPMLVFYIIIQKKFIASIVTSGIVG